MTKKDIFLECIKSNSSKLTIKQIQELTGIPRTTVLRYCNEFDYDPLKQTTPWNKGLTKDSNPTLRKISKKTKGLKRRKRTPEEKQKISSTMKKNGNSGGFRESGGRGDTHIYREIVFNSNASLSIAKIFDDEDIEWEQPIIGFKYTDSTGVIRVAHLDFYLPEYDLYVAVKTNITSTVRKKLLNIRKIHNIKLMIVDELMYKRLLYNKVNDVLIKF